MFLIKNAPISIRFKGHCGSCWSFAAVGAVEGQYNKHFPGPVEFSEQQLIDCSEAYGNMGCHGGFSEYSFNYLKSNGIELLSAYLYQESVSRRVCLRCETIL